MAGKWRTRQRSPCRRYGIAFLNGEWKMKNPAPPNSQFMKSDTWRHRETNTTQHTSHRNGWLPMFDPYGAFLPYKAGHQQQLCGCLTAEITVTLISFWYFKTSRPDISTTQGMQISIPLYHLLPTCQKKCVYLQREIKITKTTTNKENNCKITY